MLEADGPSGLPSSTIQNIQPCHQLEMCQPCDSSLLVHIACIHNSTPPAPPFTRTVYLTTKYTLPTANGFSCCLVVMPTVLAESPWDSTYISIYPHGPALLKAGRVEQADETPRNETLLEWLGYLDGYGLDWRINNNSR